MQEKMRKENLENIENIKDIKNPTSKEKSKAKSNTKLKSAEDKACEGKISVRAIVTVHDMMQDGYAYELIEPAGKNFDPEFKPDLTPKEMLALGVFGGLYMRDCRNEFPVDWFTHAKLAPEGVNKHIAALNLFKTNASQSLGIWRKNGWIYKDDPRGWFQWYCRYYMGRRIPAEDSRQIRRWKAITRHAAQISHNCRPGDLFCRARQRQAILHWAYDSRNI
jgi:hypothetical protein